MTKIAIFQYDLGQGGVQKSLINLLNNINLKKYQITLFINEDGTFFERSIPDAITIIKIPKFHPINKVLPFTVVNKLYGNMFGPYEYDIAIDFSGYQNECAVGALNIKADRRAIWIHNDVGIRLKTDKKYRLRWRMYKSKYKRFDTNVAVSKGITDSFCKESGAPKDRVIVINNFIDTKEIIDKSKEKCSLSVDNNKYNLVALGRLNHIKGYDIMLGIMSDLVKKRKDIHLYIIGDGPDRKIVNNIVEEMKLPQYVTLLGGQPNPFKYMRLMDGLITTSRSEGQGMNILEAKCLGLQLFISKNLEAYTNNIKGYNNLVTALANAKKTKNIKFDTLWQYNGEVLNGIDMLLKDAR